MRQCGCCVALLAVTMAEVLVGAEVPEHVRLIRDLMGNYDKNTKPVLNQTDSILVLIDSKLFSILKVDEAEETITYAHWFSLRWTDMLLRWNPADYGGIDAITIRRDQLWIPDILIYEGMTRDSPQSDKQMFIKVTSEGSAFLATPEILKVHCHFDVSNFPYDGQNCSNTYVSWTYAGEDVVLKPAPNSDRTAQFKKHSEWELLGVEARFLTVKYLVGENIQHFYEVYFHLVIKRRPLYYIVSLVIPIYAIAQVTIVGIFTPHNAQHERETKVELGLTGMLSMSVMLLVVSGYTPRSATDYPLLGVFMLQELLIIGVAAIVSTAILCLHSKAMLGESPSACLLAITGYRRRVFGKADGRNAFESRNKDNVYHAQHSLSTRIKDVDMEMLALVQSLYQILRGMRQYIALKHEHSERYRHWTRICRRLDAYCLVAFLFINTLFFAFFLLAPLGSRQTDTHNDGAL